MMIRRQPMGWYDVYTHTLPLSQPQGYLNMQKNDIEVVISNLNNQQSVIDILSLKIPQLRHARGNYLGHT